MVTLKEVAKHADVSTATVSKVLSNTPYVSEETRERVLRAVQELGYVPNLAARALSKGRTQNIGVIFPFNYDHLFGDPLMLTLLEGIEVVCTEQRYNMLLSRPRIPVDSDQYQALIRSGYLDGAIVFENLPDKTITDVLQQSGYPWVAIGYHSALGEVNTIRLDDFGGAKAIAEYLIGLGHRKIGVIGIPEGVVGAAEQRMDGYKAAFAEAHLDFSKVPVTLGSFSVESGYRAAAELLEHDKTLTAILCLNDRMALGAIRYLQLQGLHVPKDISVVGFDDIAAALDNDPPLTTVQQPAYEMGTQAAKHLFSMIDANINARKNDTLTIPDEGRAPIIFSAPLVIRDSSAPPSR